MKFEWIAKQLCHRLPENLSSYGFLFIFHARGWLHHLLPLDILEHRHFVDVMHVCTPTTTMAEGRWKNRGLGVNTWRKQPDVGVDRGEVLVLRGAFYETHWDCHSDLFSYLSLTLLLLFIVLSSASLLRMLLKIMKHVIKCLALFNHANLIPQYTCYFFCHVRINVRRPCRGSFAAMEYF